MLSPQAGRIREMFSAIAPRYDLLNHLLSLNVDRSWRRQAASLLADRLEDRQALCLDLCCGTGDLLLEMAKRGRARIVGSDFSHAMLKLGRQKLAGKRLESRVRLLEADALRLPFPDDTFDGLAVAFGLRNLENRADGLGEMWRVLKPQARVVVLEFSRPTLPLFNRLFQFYFHWILPGIGKGISGHGTAYRYLHDSVQEFPDQARLCQLMKEAGFAEVSFRNLSGGIAALHWGVKDGSRESAPEQNFSRSGSEAVLPKIR